MDMHLLHTHILDSRSEGIVLKSYIANIMVMSGVAGNISIYLRLSTMVISIADGGACVDQSLPHLLGVGSNSVG